MEILKNNIEKAWIDNSMLVNIEIQKDIRKTIKLLDSGKLRIAEKINGFWQVNDWVKKAVIMYFQIQSMKTTENP